MGGTHPQGHSHPGPSLLILVDARPLEPQAAWGRPKGRRSFCFHCKAVPRAGLEAHVEPPRCSASLSGLAPEWGGAGDPGGGASEPWQGLQGPASPGVRVRGGRIRGRARAGRSPLPLGAGRGGATEQESEERGPPAWRCRDWSQEPQGPADKKLPRYKATPGLCAGAVWFLKINTPLLPLIPPQPVPGILCSCQALCKPPNSRF